MMKRLLAIVALAAMLFSLFSCSQVKESDGELAVIAEALIKKSEILNEIYWGDGIPPVEGGEVSFDGKYVIADMNGVSDYGITDANTLKEYTRSVYTENESDNIFKNYLNRTAYTDSFGGYTYTEVINRYIIDGEGRLFVSPDHDSLLLGSIVEYDFSSITVVERSRKTVTLQIGVTVKNGEDSVGYRDTLSLEMRKENGEYRLNTPTYCVYDKK